jgi:hypothetical protein
MLLEHKFTPAILAMGGFAFAGVYGTIFAVADGVYAHWVHALRC